MRQLLTTLRYFCNGNRQCWDCHRPTWASGLENFRKPRNQQSNYKWSSNTTGSRSWANGHIPPPIQMPVPNIPEGYVVLPNMMVKSIPAFSGPGWTRREQQYRELRIIDCKVRTDRKSTDNWAQIIRFLHFCGKSEASCVSVFGNAGTFPRGWLNIPSWLWEFVESFADQKLPHSLFGLYLGGPIRVLTISSHSACSLVSAGKRNFHRLFIYAYSHVKTWIETSIFEMSIFSERRPLAWSFVASGRSSHNNVITKQITILIKNNHSKW